MTTEIVRRVIGIDDVDLNGKLIVIEEQHGSDGNFLINTVLSHALEKGNGICLVLFHNTFGHYNNIGLKLGYNLNVLKERGEITVVEPMKLITNNIEEIGHDTVDASCPELSSNKQTLNDVIPNVTKSDPNIVKHLFQALKNKYDELLKSRESITIIIDDLSHLFEMNLSLKDVWLYLRYLRSLMQEYPNTTVCILTHTYRVDADFCQPDMIVVALRKMADLNITVEPLTTGHANDRSGKMSVMWKTHSVRKTYNWAERTTYLFKLHDRQIKIFNLGGTDPLC